MVIILDEEGHVQRRCQAPSAAAGESLRSAHPAQAGTAARPPRQAPGAARIGLAALGIKRSECGGLGIGLHLA